eukprot:3222168-Alexandrium_andersonii.AAC.1
MSVPLYGGQVNAVHQLVQTFSWAPILDATTFWRLIRPFCVTHPGRNVIDWFHHGDPSWSEDYCCKLTGYWDEFLKK